MALYSFIEYLKYRWKAMGRHGTHSPFVYDLIEHVLLDKSVLPKEFIVDIPESGLKYENLVSRICAYYKYTAKLFVPSDNNENVQAEIIVVNGVKAKDWAKLLNKYAHLMKNNSAFIVTDIHKSLAQSGEWKKLCAHERVQMSIDVFGLGLLFFKEEFKVKQHFVLKY